MSNCYNIEGIKKEITKDLNRDRAFLEAWKKVTFPTKKDGTPFANMSKNFDGASYHACGYHLQPGENELTVYAHSNECGYIHDSINMYELVRYLKDDDMIAKTNNYMPKVSYLEQVYNYDIDDAKKVINKRIKYYESEVASLEVQLVNVESVFTSFKKKYDELINGLLEDCNGRNELYRTVFDTVVSKY